jgi:hypothetical protein
MKHFLLLFFVGASVAAAAQNIVPEQFKEFERMFVQPKHYVVSYTATPPLIDGNIDEESWSAAAWTDDFRDIEGKLSQRPLPYYATKAKMLWDRDYLYVAAKLDDEHVWGTLDRHDQIVYYDNDFEVFIDPGNTAHNYFEIEINALNTIFDLFLTKPYRSGAHLLIAWDCRDLKHAVKINGTLNNPNDTDRGWTVEMAIPFKSLDNVPQAGNIWRINFSRVEWDTQVKDKQYVKKTDASGRTLPENNWVWSPQGAIDMHRPERWGYLLFAQPENGAQLPEFQLPYAELQRQWLWFVFYKQQKYRDEHHKYALTLQELGIPSEVAVNGVANRLSMDATAMQFTAVIACENQPPVFINNEGQVRSLNKD